MPQWLQGFINGVVQNLVAEGIVTAVVGGGVIAWLKRRGSPWLVPIFWGIGGAAMILIGTAALRVIAIPLPAKADTVTIDNLEAHVNAWADSFHYSKQKLPDADDVYFSYVLRNEYGRNTRVSRPKKPPFDDYLILQAGILVGPQDAEKLTKLSKLNSEILIRDLRMEMARFRIGYQNIVLPLKAIALERQVPITAGLTESGFIQALDDIDSADVLLQEAVTKELDELSGGR